MLHKAVLLQPDRGRFGHGTTLRWRRPEVLQGDFPSLAARYPDRARRVKWAISLESIVAQAPEVRAGLALVESLWVPGFNDAGPFFPSTTAENGVGEECP